MAGTSSENQQFGPDTFLSPNQQDLLIAALSSQATGSNDYEHQLGTGIVQGRDASKTQLPSATQQDYPSGINSSSIVARSDLVDAGGSASLDVGDTSFADWFGASDDLAYDAIEDGQIWTEEQDGFQADLAITDDADGEPDLHDKRKNPSDATDDPEGNGNKRRESEEKVAKKPGRKPLISEASTKRKAQNRAAQRAFRERKEQHLKDLEIKITELEKTSDSVNQENGLLRARVQRLQTEVQEYRKRLSLNSSRSVPSSRANSYATSGNVANAKLANFQFEFPRFGYPLSQQFINNDMAAKFPSTSSPSTNKIPDQGSIPGILSRQSDGRRNVSVHEGLISPVLSLESPVQDSPISLSKSDSSSNDTTEQSVSNANNSSWTNNASLDSGVISPAHSEAVNDEAGLHKHQGSVSSVATNQNRVFKFNSGGATSMTNSPSTSPWSQFGPSSSVGTTPEPGHDSPNQDNGKDNQNGKGEGTTADINNQPDSNSALQSEANSAPQTESPFNINPINPTQFTAATFPIKPSDAFLSSNTDIEPKGFDWLANENNSGQFDPILFGQYRESQDAIVGTGDFTNGFFNDALPFSLGTPMGLDAAALSNFPGLSDIEQADITDFNFDGLDEQEPQYQQQPDKDENGVESIKSPEEKEIAKCKEMMMSQMKEGEKTYGDNGNDNIMMPPPGGCNLDIDSLCHEMQTKARCSETGLWYDKKDMDAMRAKMTMPT